MRTNAVAQIDPPSAFQNTNFTYGNPLMPAAPGMRARSAAVKRPKNTDLPP